MLIDLGILPLFVVITKCHDCKLCHEVIALLMSSLWHEGMWDSLLYRKVREWIIEVKEEGIGPRLC
jgi:hypothetical protein